MTTQVAQSAAQFLTAAISSPRVSQSSVQFLVRTFALSSPTQVSQSSLQLLVRKYPIDLMLEVFPSQETFQSRQPKKRVDLL